MERVKSGLRRARAEGKRLGRPAVSVDVVKARKLMERHSLRAVARKLGCDPKTLRNRLRIAG